MGQPLCIGFSYMYAGTASGGGRGGVHLRAHLRAQNAKGGRFKKYQEWKRRRITRITHSYKLYK